MAEGEGVVTIRAASDFVFRGGQWASPSVYRADRAWSGATR